MTAMALPTGEDACARCGQVHGSCRAHNRQGGPCGNPALPGSPVCHWHGGEAPQTKRKAALRLAGLVDPAIAVLSREMVNAEKSADRQRAANSILDRAGISRTPDLDAATARAILIERLQALRTPPTPITTADEEAPVDAELVPDPEESTDG